MSEHHINDVAKATLQQFNAATNNIQRRESLIADLKKKVTDTQPAATLNAEARAEIKELEKLNQKDREFVKTAIDFYEDITGEAVGVGDLFSQEKEDEE
jgi:HAMP domain-containing protein